VSTCNGVRTCDEEWTWPCAKPLDIARKRREWLGFCATEGMGLDGFKSRPRHLRSEVKTVTSVKLGTFALRSRAALILVRLKPLETSADDPKQTLA
jgi:hypothetical protein